MGYRTLSTPLIDRGSRGALDAAIEHARSWAAHLDVCCFAEEDIDPGFGLYGTTTMVRPETTALDRCDALAETVRGRLLEAGIAWSCRRHVSAQGGAARAFAQAARFADVALLSQPLGRDAHPWDDLVFEAMLFDARLPVLVPAPRAKPDYRSVLVAWDGSSVALAAMRAAVPLLAEARAVTLAVDDRDEESGLEMVPQARDAVTFLSRHGVNAEVLPLPARHADTAAELRGAVYETAADLMVMGAYGHSRIRERLLGGVTESILSDPPTSLLVAH